MDSLVGIMNWGVSDAIALFVVNLNINVSPAFAYSGFGLVLLNSRGLYS